MSEQNGEIKDTHQFAEALGFLCSEKRTGGLLIRAEGREGEVFLHEGRITHAQFGHCVGLKALLFMLGWEAGTYNFTPQQTSDQTTIEMEAAAVLSLLAQQVQEWNRITQDQTLNLNAVLHLLPQASGTIRLTKEDWDILARIDGRKSLKDISYEMYVPPLDLVKVMQRFRDAGLVGAGSRHPEKAGAVLGKDYLSALEKELNLAIGPVASIVLEEALKDLQEAAEPLTADKIEIVLERLSKAMPDEKKRVRFEQTARRLAVEFSGKPPLKEDQEETKG
ncbi:MAG: hypothetical protein A2Z08_12360 [Deltaproteobacteria bacterium RBG_16_54_11]|jgi:hypothetical protein|nr:MAG: hypothetical protein A2Z08_12360 [Deltaproteobacteria bacterium RBG_16_54_11]